MKKAITMTITVLLIIALLIVAARAFVAAPGEWYAKAVAWAYDQEITVGTSSNTFSPDRPITRAELVTMLWRMNGSPEPRSGHPFVDVPVVTPVVFGNVGRLYIGSYSVALNSPMTQEVVDKKDSCGYYEGWGNTIIGDHYDHGFWRIRELHEGDTCYILHEDGTKENFVCVRVDLEGTNTGGDVLDSTGASAFDDPDSDMFMYTCNPVNAPRSITVVYWVRTDGTGAVVESILPRIIPECGGAAG